MRKFLLLMLVVISQSSMAQVYKCGVTVDNYQTEENSDYIKSICSDKSGNIYYIRNAAIYKNKSAWVEYKPNSYNRYFSFPWKITSDKDGNIIVFDGDRYALYKITPAGQVSLFAGMENKSGSKDTIATHATFGYLQALCADNFGNVYVAQYNKIRKISADGVVSTLAGQDISGFKNGAGSEALFNNISSLTCDKSGNIYTTEYGNDVVRKVTPEGVVDVFAGGNATYQYVDDERLSSGFYYMSGIFYGHDDHIYISEHSASRIRRISPTGKVQTIAGYKYTYGGADYNTAKGPGHLVGINNPTVITQAPDGTVYVLAKYYGFYTSQQYQVIRKININNDCESEKVKVSTVCGNGYVNETREGKGREAEFKYINGITKDKFGNLFIAEMNSKNILKMTPDLNVKIFFTDETNSHEPVRAIATDNEGFIYASFGSRITVLNQEGNEVRTYFQKVGEQFRATRMMPDNKGNLYFTDAIYDNIRKLNLETGDYFTYAGGTAPASISANEGFVDGELNTARFYFPVGIDIDKNGNIYIADGGNNAIRKIDPDGKVSTIAGGEYGNVDGKGKSAKLGHVSGLKVDKDGNVYFIDESFDVIKKITFPDTMVTTIAGNTYQYVENQPRYIDGNVSMARFQNPIDLVVEEDGNIYVADQGNSVVRKVTGLNTPVAGFNGQWNNSDKKFILFYPNPASDIIYFHKSGVFTISDLNNKVYLSDDANRADVSFLSPGMYLIYFEETGKAEKFIKK